MVCGGGQGGVFSSILENLEQQENWLKVGLLYCHHDSKQNHVLSVPTSDFSCHPVLGRSLKSSLLQGCRTQRQGGQLGILRHWVDQNWKASRNPSHSTYLDSTALKFTCSQFQPTPVRESDRPTWSQESTRGTSQPWPGHSCWGPYPDSGRSKFSEENGLGSWGKRHKYVHMKFQIIKWWLVHGYRKTTWRVKVCPSLTEITTFNFLLLVLFFFFAGFFIEI